MTQPRGSACRRLGRVPGRWRQRRYRSSATVDSTYTPYYSPVHPPPWRAIGKIARRSREIATIRWRNEFIANVETANDCISEQTSENRHELHGGYRAFGRLLLQQSVELVVGLDDERSGQQCGFV